jgi:hypothetical protein
VLALAAGLLAGRLWLSSPEPEQERESPVETFPDPMRRPNGPVQLFVRRPPGPGETAMLALSTSEPGLPVYLDGFPTGRKSPIPIAAPLYARPGDHAVQFVWKGRLTPSRYVHLSSGEVSTLRNVPVPPP